MTPRVVVLSAHLDDGVLSASAQLVRPGAELVTVFSGAPPQGLPLTPWGRLTGATSMGERHQERLAEDGSAAELLGCVRRHLDLPEEEYRRQPLAVDVVAETLRPVLLGADEVWCPAAIGDHPDHRLVREATLAARPWQDDASPELHLFADLPYSLSAGQWPRWVRRSPDEEPAVASLHSAVRGSGVRGLEPIVLELAADLRARKADAVACYASQLPALGFASRTDGPWSDLVTNEAAWRVGW